MINFIQPLFDWVGVDIVVGLLIIIVLVLILKD